MLCFPGSIFRGHHVAVPILAALPGGGSVAELPMALALVLLKGAFYLQSVDDGDCATERSQLVKLYYCCCTIGTCEN